MNNLNLVNICLDSGVHFKEYSKKYCVAIHAWVLMTNHIHILCTPLEDGGVSKMMQSIGRRYVQYFNH